MRNRWIASFVAASLMTGAPALAMQSGDPVALSDVQPLIDAGNFEAAVEKLQMYVDGTPHDANGFNLLGYSYRKLEQYDLAKEAYDMALRLDPGHVGVHEYLGELYLQTGKPEEAKAELAKLAELCGTGCPEYQALAKSIAAHR